MDVIDRSTEHFLRPNIPIISGSFLPETKRRFARPLSNGQPLKQRIVRIDEPLLHTKAKRPFDRE